MRQYVLSQFQLSAVSRPSRPFSTSYRLARAFQEGDFVILRDKRKGTVDGTLVKLQASNTTHSHKGVVKHSDIIGKEPRQLVLSSKGSTFRVHEPTLAEYVRLTPRLVTPIYSSDANLIVSLLDIHVDTTAEPLRTEPPLEILEAGTGHGALTLHLSRAIHAANSPLPRLPHMTHQEEPEDAIYLGESMADLHHTSSESWRNNRRAIVHTLDISNKHSKHAQKIVKGFRGGLYADNIDFHVGDVSKWIAAQQAQRHNKDPFLTHVFLDLPNADNHLASVAPVLHTNGLLAVFNPSITQIADCVSAIRQQKMPYLLDQVIELGAGTIREWDVRAVQPRATLSGAKSPEGLESRGAETLEPMEGQIARDDELAKDLTRKEEQWAMVCRPKVGQHVVGGGFLGLWRRMEQTLSQDQDMQSMSIDA